VFSCLFSQGSRCAATLGYPITSPSGYPRRHNYFLSRPSQADDPDVGLDGDGVLDVRQVEAGHVAQDALGGVQPESGKSFPKHSLPVVGTLPRQQRRLVVRANGVGLLVEHTGQRSSAASAGADAENNVLFHRKSTSASGLPNL
jgi:hypothetical protein